VELRPGPVAIPCGRGGWVVPSLPAPATMAPRASAIGVESGSVARAGLDVRPARLTPPGLLAQWRWNALARFYAAGEYGLSMDYRPERADRPPWRTLLPPREHREGGT
jgi:hypothetical protein